ncbi:MAG: DUF262 domain-containing protein [Haemophilus parainfluenzae]|jgi:hypothetical protein pcarcW_05949|nr:DUF262 domain-containing protein [Haemophilus parainfluenzae]
MNYNELNYKVRSIQLLNYINDIKGGRLIKDPFFQRNLVWRDTHKRDFIETILMGYPFPQIFLSKGKIDLEHQISIASIIDGQQRTNAIEDFLNDKFPVNGKVFSKLSDKEKELFYKYEIAIIELDLTHDDPKVQEIFQRINRTANALTGIEKKASEFSSSEYMMVAEYISKQSIVSLDDDDLNIINDDNYLIKEGNYIRENPYLDENMKKWFKSINTDDFSKLITSDSIFTKTEVAKKVNLMYTLNLMTTYLCSDIYNRNEKVWEYAEINANSFEEKTDLVNLFNNVAKIFLGFKFRKGSFWLKKANFFSLFLVLCNNYEKISNLEELKAKLESFKPSTEYLISAKEGVNNAKERRLRDGEITKLLGFKNESNIKSYSV